VESRALAQNVRIGPRVLPRVHEALHAAAQAVGVAQPVAAFVYASAEANAQCMSEREDRRILVFVASSLIQQLAPQELLFLFGHELGHVLFRHFRYPPSRPAAEDVPVPARVLELHRYAELSADRAGWLAAGTMDVAVRALVKIASGLDEPDLDIDVSEFVGQIHELRDGDGDETILYATHPPLALRAAALLRAESMLRGIVEGQNTAAELGAYDELIRNDIDTAACGSARTGIADRGRTAAFWRAARELCRDGEFSRRAQDLMLAEFGGDRVEALRRLLRDAGTRQAASSQLEEKVTRSRADVDESPTLVERLYDEIMNRLRPEIPGL